MSLTGDERHREEILPVAARADGGKAARERADPDEFRTLGARARAALVHLRASQDPLSEHKHDFVFLCNRPVACQPESGAKEITRANLLHNALEAGKLRKRRRREVDGTKCHQSKDKPDADYRLEHSQQQTHEQHRKGDAGRNACPPYSEPPADFKTIHIMSRATRRCGTTRGAA